MRGFSGLQGNFWSKHIKLVDFWGWWNAGGSFQLRNCNFWTPSVWSWFAVHKHAFLGIENLHPVFQHPSGVQPACSLLAARLSLTASPPGKRGKAESGDREKAEQRHVSGEAITPHYRASSPRLMWVLPETLQQQCLKGLLLHYSHFKFWPFKPFCLFQAAVSFLLHVFRLSVWSHNSTKTKAMSRGWRSWKRIWVYSFFSWVLLLYLSGWEWGM